MELALLPNGLGLLKPNLSGMPRFAPIEFGGKTKAEAIDWVLHTAMLEIEFWLC